MNRAHALSNTGVEVLWAAVSDVTSWPHHLSTFTEVISVDAPPEMGLGARFDVRQPGLPPATYEITEWITGERFTWVARSPGITTTATHEVTAVDSGARVDLTVEWRGVLAGPVRALLGRKTQRMVELEATTLAAVAQRG